MEEVIEDKKIKIGFNIYLYYWTIPVLISFVLINYFCRNFKIEGLNAGLMISVVTFLFGFIISITFSMLMARVSALREAISNEAARLVSLYFLSKTLGSKFHEKIIERIDHYTLSTLRDYNFYEASREAYYGIYKDIELMEIKNSPQQSAADSFLYALGELGPFREKLEYLTKTRIEWSVKFANYLLGGILIVLLFLNRGDLFTNILFIILSTAIIFIFLIIEDYDDLRIGDYSVNISNSEQLFDLIEKERYYPQHILGKVKLQKGKSYRIGIYDKTLGQERIFKLTYNPLFNFKIARLINKFKRK
jgi:hypothetical protein